MRVVCDSIDFSFEVPFNILNEDQAQINHSQTLKRLNERGLIYKVIEPHRLTIEEMNELYKEKKIKFLERYERKFKQFNKRQPKHE